MAKKIGLNISKGILEDLYLNHELSMYDIAKTFGVSVTTIFYYMKKFSIPARDNKDVFTFWGRSQTEHCKQVSRQTHKNKVVQQDTKEKISFARALRGIGHKKNRSDGYIAIYFPSHPKSRSDGYIMEHVLMMECFIGRWLRDDEVVHHINGDKTDNRKENLMLMTASEHMSLHMKERYKKNA